MTPIIIGLAGKVVERPVHRKGRPCGCRPSCVRAKRVQVPAFVQKRDLGEVEVEVAGVRGQVHRLQRSAGFLLDDVQALAKPQKVLHVLKCAVSATAVEVHHISRAADR